MFRPFAATCLSALLVLTPVAAAPARAGERDIARIVAGAATLFVIGKVIKDANDRKKEKERQAEAERAAADARARARADRIGRNRGWSELSRPDPQRRHRHKPPHEHPDRTARADRNVAPIIEVRRRLPASCLSTLPDGNGTLRVFGKRCLAATMPDADRLPQACETSVYAYGRQRPVYGESCLARFGWSV